LAGAQEKGVGVVQETRVERAGCGIPKVMGGRINREEIT